MSNTAVVPRTRTESVQEIIRKLARLSGYDLHSVPGYSSVLLGLLEESGAAKEEGGLVAKFCQVVKSQLAFLDFMDMPEQSAFRHVFELLPMLLGAKQPLVKLLEKERRSFAACYTDAAKRALVAALKNELDRFTSPERPRLPKKAPGAPKRQIVLEDLEDTQRIESSQVPETDDEIEEDEDTPRRDGSNSFTQRRELVAIDESDEEETRSSTESGELRSLSSMVSDRMARRRGGVGGAENPLGQQLDKVRDGSRDLSNDGSSALSGSVRAEETRSKNGFLSFAQGDFDEPRNGASRGVRMSRLGYTGAVLHEGVHVRAKRGTIERLREEGGSVQDLRSKRQRRGDSIDDGCEVVSVERAATRPIEIDVSKPFFQETDGDAPSGMVLRSDRDTEEFLREGLHGVFAGALSGSAGNYEVALYEPPTIKLQGLKSVVDWTVRPKGGNPGRHPTGVVSPPSDVEARRLDGMLSRDQRRFSLFYIKHLVRHDTGTTMAVLAQLGGNGSGASGAPPDLCSGVYSKESIDYFTLDNSTVPGYCCRNPERSGVCAQCFARLRKGDGEMAELRDEIGE